MDGSFFLSGFPSLGYIYTCAGGDLLTDIVMVLVSPLPVIKNAAESERVAADSRMDRMTIWMRNVEKVVEDAKQNFAAVSSTTKDLPLPALPLPLSRNASQNRTSRLPRRVLAASQIFQEDENGNLSPMGDQTMNSMYLTANDGDVSRGSVGPGEEPSSPAAASRNSAGGVGSPAPLAKTTTMTNGDAQGECEERSQMQMRIPEIHTPSRQRRATVSTRSPEPVESQVRTHAFDDTPLDTQVDGGSPSKRKEKSRSHGNLFQRHIAPILVLEAELSKTPPPPPTPRLSEVLDRNLFIAPLLTSRDDLLDSSIEHVRRETSMEDDLNASPCHVEPYPPRPRASQDAAAIPDTPSRHRIEGVYDRFLMATSGVKRLGKGYQSDNLAPVGSGIGNTSASLGPSAYHGHQQNQQQPPLRTRAFYSTRRPMPPPVSSDDVVRDDDDDGGDEQRRAASVDELGVRIVYPGARRGDSPGANGKEEGNTTVAFKMKKAMKLMVPKSTAMSRRLSRMG
ncbi:hypothetical protein M413DRAFT_393485 [Hebeloma cylindrosporum]|uniref:Uncharacterized protein n=1 Tax=Hebeloma cylindrosporum TaxID=76867 RepID=A0A0C2XZG5_HEBCY|nr:hypothetical protein M413DRAFT_393485 [Hebeloma cylindrosporum h7]